MDALEETPKDAMDVLEDLMAKRKWKTMPSSKRSSTRGHSNVRDGKGRKDLLERIEQKRERARALRRYQGHRT